MDGWMAAFRYLFYKSKSTQIFDYIPLIKTFSKCMEYLEKYSNANIYTYSYSLSMVSLPVNSSRQGTKKRKAHNMSICKVQKSKVDFCGI
jgi:hypothetical protein